jgi:hypothetical protein
LRELSSALYVAGDKDESDPEVNRRRELRQDIAALERMLTELRARHPDIDLSAIPLPHARGPRIQSAEELEDLRRALVAQISLLLGQGPAPEEEPAKPKRAPAKRRTAPKPKPAVS